MGKCRKFGAIKIYLWVFTIYTLAVLKITAGHWPFSKQFQYLVNQNSFWLAKFTVHFQWEGHP